MKKLLILIALSSALFAEAKVYVGAGVGFLHEKLDNSKAKTYNHGKLKVGYGDINAYAVEFSFDYTQKDNKETIYNATDSYGVNVELLKAFDFNTFFNPYLKAGFGFGYYKSNDKKETSMHYGNFIFGTGVFIPFLEYYDLQLGYEYKTISYEKAEEEKNNISSNAHIGYIGINVRF